MKRIAIVGCSGSGKSRLGRRLGERLGLPVVHLDLLYWRPGWTKVGDAEMTAAVDAAAMAEAWIIEGLAIDCSAMRFARADTIVWLEPPVWLCLWRAVARAIEYRGRSRPDLPEGCPETFDLSFYRWILRYNRDTRYRLVAALERAGKGTRIVRLTRAAEVDAFVAACGG